MARETFPIIWANAGTSTTPETAYQNTGWTKVKPPYQYFNWFWKKVSSFCQKVEQQGILEWSADTLYESKGLSMGSNGKVYQAVQANSAQNPVTDTTHVYWRLFEASALRYSGTTVFTGYVPLSLTELDIHSVVGANRAMVYLMIKFDTAYNGTNVIFKPNDISEGVGIASMTTLYGGGASGVAIANGAVGFVYVPTDENGKLKWYGNEAGEGGTVVTVINYQVCV